MKKLKFLCLLVPVPFIVGLALDIIGSRIGNVTLAKVGIGIMSYGTPILMFFLVVLGLVMLISGRWSLDDEKKKTVDSGSAAESESRKIEDINTSYGYDSQMKNAQFQTEHVANNYKNASRGDKIKGWLFFGFLMTDFFLIMVFAFIGIYIGMFICFGIFGGTIIISLIVKVILEKTSMSQKFSPDKYVETVGKVRACMLSSTGSVGGGRHNSTVRVTSVTYRIVLDVDGEEYNAYSRIPYDEGTFLSVAVKRNGGKQAKIISEVGGKELD